MHVRPVEDEVDFPAREWLMKRTGYHEMKRHTETVCFVALEFVLLPTFLFLQGRDCPDPERQNCFRFLAG